MAAQFVFVLGELFGSTIDYVVLKSFFIVFVVGMLSVVCVVLGMVCRGRRLMNDDS